MKLSHMLIRYDVWRSPCIVYIYTQESSTCEGVHWVLNRGVSLKNQNTQRILPMVKSMRSDKDYLFLTIVSMSVGTNYYHFVRKLFKSAFKCRIWIWISCNRLLSIFHEQNERTTSALAEDNLMEKDSNEVDRLE